MVTAGDLFLQKLDWVALEGIDYPFRIQVQQDLEGLGRHIDVVASLSDAPVDSYSKVVVAYCCLNSYPTGFAAVGPFG